MQKKIAMAVGPGFEDLEFWAVYMRMLEEGAEVFIASSEEGQRFKSKSQGLEALSSCSYRDLKARNLDAILIPGGYAPDKIRRDKNLIQLISDMHKEGKVIGFICHAGSVALSAGLVKGHKVTGSLGIKDDLEAAGAQWVDEPAFQDRNLVWGRVVEDIPSYNKALVKAIFF